jgi:hypothetical protein
MTVYVCAPITNPPTPHTPTLHLFPQENHVSNYVSFELRKVFTNASFVQNTTALYLCLLYLKLAVTKVSGAGHLLNWVCAFCIN